MKNHKQKDFIIILILILTLLGTSIQSQTKNYYIKTDNNLGINFSKSLGIASAGYSNNGFYGNVGYAKYAYKNIGIAFNVASFKQFNNIELQTINYGNSTGDNVSLNINVINAATFSLQYDVLKFPKKFIKTTYKQILPFNFVLSPYFSVSVFDWINATEFTYYENLDDENQTDNINTQNFFSSYETGLQIRSSVFNISAGYSWRIGTSEDYITSRYYNSNTGNYVADGYKNLDLSFNTLFFRIGVNLDWFFPSEIKKRQKIYLPIFEEPQYIALRGTKGNLIYQNDAGSFDIPLKNIGKGEGKSLTVSIKSWGDYYGLKVNLINSYLGNLKQGKTHLLSPRIVTTNVTPGPKNFDIIISGNDNHFKQEIPITINITPELEKDDYVTRKNIFDPTELDYNIPIGKQQSNRKALLVLIDSFDNKTIEPINVGNNVINTLEKYVKSSFGISDVIKRENLSKSQFGELFDSDIGTISQWVDENTELFIYILSHGLVDKKQSKSTKSYILCKDSNPGYAKNLGYSVNKLIANLDELNIKNYVLVIDACYSGTGKGTLAPGLQIEAGVLNPQNGVIVSSSGENVSYLIEDKGHTAFSYYFLKSTKKLGNEKRHSDISINEIFEDMKHDKSGIGNFTIKEYSQKQEPQLFGKKEIKLIDK